MIPKGINPLNSWLSHQEIEFSKSEMQAIPAAVRKQVYLFCYYDDKKITVPKIGMNTMSLGIYVNHSKTPNLELNQPGQFKTLRVIKKGEELLMDYDHAFGGRHIF